MGQRVLVTGASGFVGSAVARGFASRGWQVAAAYRQRPALLPDGIEGFVVPDLLDAAGWHAALRGVDAVVHCAARVHVMHEVLADPLQAFRAANVEGTALLANAAQQAGAQRFIFISSAKVNGESTSPGRPFRSDQVAHPVDPYAVSKFEAETRLAEVSARTGLRVTTIRPPLIYGPGVKANFHKMMAWLHRGIPLPFARLENRRSLLALSNLVDLIVCCAEHPAAANQTFLASDDEDLSTTELLRRLGAALHRPARLFSLPPGLVTLSARLLGRKAALDRLYGSLQLDITPTKTALGWRPPVTVNKALQKAADAFLSKQGAR